MTVTRISSWPRRRLVVTGLAALLPLSRPALAQTYPDRSIRLIVPYAPGGSSDIVGRIVGDALGRAIGQPVVVENVGGGGGAVGAQRATGATPDGYTLLLGANSELLINKALQPNLSYDAVRDFTPVALVGSGAIVVIGKSALRAATLPEVVSLSQRTPGGLNFGTSGVGTIQHLAGELLRVRLGLNATHVPFRGAGPLMNDVVAGNVDLGVATLASALGFLRAGQVRPYLVTSSPRTDFAPEIPATSEFSALGGVQLETWYGIFGPARLPPAVVSRLEQAMLTVLAAPELRNGLANNGLSIRRMMGGELRDFVALENDNYRALVAEAKINIQ